MHKHLTSFFIYCFLLFLPCDIQAQTSDANGMPVITEELKKAEEGNVSQQVLVGKNYLQGVYGSPNYADAYFWLSIAYNAYGDEEIRKLRDQAAQQVPAKRRKSLDKSIRDWEPQSTDNPEFIENLKLSAERGNTTAQMELAKYYMRHQVTGGRIELDKAAGIYHDLAMKGIADAQYTLANMYAKGLGVEKSPSSALYWYILSTPPGDVREESVAMLRLLTSEEIILVNRNLQYGSSADTKINKYLGDERLENAVKRAFEDNKTPR